MSYVDKYTELDPVSICEQIGQPYRKFTGYCKISCYNTTAHKNGDRHPSLTVYGFERGYYCYVCDESGTNSWLLKQYGVREEDYMPVKIERNVQAKQEVMTEVPDVYSSRLQAVWEKLPMLPPKARAIVEAKGFDAEAFEYMPNLDPLMGWRWHTNQVAGWGEGIFIPYVKDGKMVTARLRRIAEDGPRFLSMPKNTMYPYYFDNIMHNKQVMVTEGETDCLTLNFLGLPAVGIPGATSGTAIARLIEQAACYDTRLIIVPDNDEPGEAFAKRLQLAAYEAKVGTAIAKLPLGKDANEFFLQASSDQLNAFLERYEPKSPAQLTDLQAVRQVFGSVEVVTHHPDYQQVTFA